MDKENLKTTFIETFEPTMLQKGFERKNKVFHRLVNGKIIQLLSYRTYGPYDFTIQFTIEPLCWGGECSRCIDDGTISEFFRMPEWEWKMGCYKQYMPKALEIVKQHVLPLFDTITNYTSYIDNMQRMNQLHSINTDVYHINLLLGNYSVCKESREALISQNLGAFRQNWGTDYHIVPERQKEFEEMLNDYNRMKKAMEANDREYIEEYIRQKEKEMLDSYVKTFYKRKYAAYLETGVLPFEIVEI